MTMNISFTKMVGAGNDFVVVDARRRPRAGLDWASLSRTLCDRHTGIGADGVLVLEPSRAADARMRVFNPDGSEAEMCGNGARCVGLYLKNGAEQGPVRIETKAGVLSGQVRSGRVAIRMTDPADLRLDVPVVVDGRRWRFGCVNTGVPHAVVRVDNLGAVDVQGLGRAVRFHRKFAPHGSNVNFIQTDSRHPDRLRIRTYERGVEAETLACGTGMAAAAILHAVTRRPVREGRIHIEVRPRSGDVIIVSLTVSRRGAALRVGDVVMEGAATRVFDGTVTWPLRRTN